jgi:hypothetical protein
VPLDPLEEFVVLPVVFVPLVLLVEEEPLDDALEEALVEAFVRETWLTS